MLIEIGQVEAIFRYPVKSMRGERWDGTALMVTDGWLSGELGTAAECRG